MEKRVREKQQILDFIKKVQKARGMTDAEITKKCNISAGAMSRWYATEKDKSRSPALESILKVLNALDVEITFRTEGLEEDNSSKENVKTEENREIDMLIMMEVMKILSSDKIPNRDKEKLYKILQVFR